MMGSKKYLLTVLCLLMGCKEASKALPVTAGGEAHRFAISLAHTSPHDHPAATPAAEGRLGLVTRGASYVEFEMIGLQKKLDKGLGFDRKYIQAQDRGRFEVSFKPDGLVEINGRSAVEGRYLFVMERSGKVYAKLASEAGFHHSYFLAGGPVSAAGNLDVDGSGHLVAIDNQSGHYSLPADTNRQLLTELARRGVTLKNLQVGVHVAGQDEALYAKGSVTAGLYSPPLDIDSIQERRLLRLKLEDGTVLERQESGLKETFYPDGTRAVTDGDVTRTTYPNGIQLRESASGLKEFHYPSGSIHRHYADGSQEIKWGNGAVEAILKNYSHGYINFPSNTVQTIFKDGSVEIEFPNGITISQYPDGRKRTTWPGGEYEDIDRNGFVSKRTKNGLEIRRYPNGVFEVVTATGDSEVTLKNGKKVHRSAVKPYQAKAMEAVALVPGAEAVGEPLRLGVVERLRYEAFITDDGFFVDAEGKLITSSAEHGFFVMDEHGRIFVGDEGLGPLRASALVNGEPMAASGSIHVQQGKLIQFDNYSVEYQAAASNRHFMEELRSRGLPAADVLVGTAADFSSPRELATKYQTQKVGLGYDFDGKIDLTLDPRASRAPFALDEGLGNLRFKALEANAEAVSSGALRAREGVEPLKGSGGGNCKKASGMSKWVCFMGDGL